MLPKRLPPFSITFRPCNLRDSVTSAAVSPLIPDFSTIMSAWVLNGVESDTLSGQ